MAYLGSYTFSDQETSYTFSTDLVIRSTYPGGDQSRFIGIRVSDPSQGERNTFFSYGTVSPAFYATYNGDSNWYEGIVSMRVYQKSVYAPPYTSAYEDHVTDITFNAPPELQYAHSGASYILTFYFGYLYQSRYVVTSTYDLQVDITNPDWYVDQEFKLNFNPNGGTPAQGKSLVVYSISSRTYYPTIPTSLNIRFSTMGYTRTGYNLIGWATNAQAQTPTYYVGQSYPFASGSIGQTGTPPGLLYAIWEVASTPIYVALNGAWKTIDKMYIRLNDTYVGITKAYVRVNGTWKEVFG